MLRLIRYGVFTLTFTLLSTTVYAQDAGSSGLPDQLETLDYTLNG